MNKLRQLLWCQAIVLGVCCMFFGSPAWAQASRTWVSGVGDDVNPCSRTAPCATLAGALLKTASGGEVDFLDPGVFDGSQIGGSAATPATVTITQPVTIDGGGGQVAALGGIAAADSLVINLSNPAAGAVILRNLSFNGYGGTGNNGIRLKSATNLVLEHVDVFGYAQNCLLVEAGAAGALVDVSDSTFSNCAVGVANQAAALLNLGQTSIFFNSTAGVASNNAQGGVLSFNSFNQNNQQNSNVATYVSGTGASLSGGNGGCAFNTQQFVIPSSVGGSGPPAGVQVAGAGFQFTTNNCGSGATITITLNFAQALPSGTVLYKYGPATAGASSSTWFQVPGVVFSNNGQSVSFSVTDNGVGDSDPTLGLIADPVVPVIPPSTSIPAMSPLGLMGTACCLALLGAWGFRVRRQGSGSVGSRKS